ncbi:hypothetical protein ACFY9C_35420 [Streptomyces filamentosus]|uniref:hypothetical protein n=1 Tax=Streptomyces filamentosus TaxID=67294 RepID=UPI0036E45ABA
MRSGTTLATLAFPLTGDEEYLAKLDRVQQVIDAAVTDDARQAGHKSALPL